MTRLAINGYGRIGRNILRAIFDSGQQQQLEIVAINDMASPEVCCHLTRYDTTHGRFKYDVEVQDGSLLIDGQNIQLICEKDPAKLPWKQMQVDLVLECTGKFKSHAQLVPQIEAGATKVLAAYPVGDADKMVVYGVNHDALQDHHQIVSNASCTTNCLAPLAKALHQAIGIDSGYMTTIHAYTNDQNLIDKIHSDLYRARSATMSMIPTKTGAAGAVGKVLPELNGKLDGMAIRVPTINVSLVDLVFIAQRNTSTEEINEVMQLASTSFPKNVIEVNARPLVSVDFNHNPVSSIFDSTQTRVQDKLVKVMAWYDNEWAYSNRMLDIAKLMAH